MPDCFSLQLVFIASTAFFIATSPANADVAIDPNTYICLEEFKSAELGIFQARVFANKKNENQSLEGGWQRNSVNPSIEANWHGEDLGRGRFSISYNSITSDNRVRLEIGNCGGKQDVCGLSTHYATNFRHSEGGINASAVWGAVVLIGQLRGDIYFQVQDETGAVLREDKLAVSTLLTVEREMSRLMAAVKKKTAALKDQCDAPAGR